LKGLDLTSPSEYKKGSAQENKKGTNLKCNPLNQTHIKDLQSIVATDRFSSGESNLYIHF
jgi:hypothetical protein